MIRTLRLKFIAVTMAIVTVFLSGILLWVVHTTGEELRSESLAAMRMAAEEPMSPGRPGQRIFPCFVIRVTSWGQSIQSAGGFDLSDEAALTEIVALAASADREVGELEEYSLRYLRLERPGSVTLVFADISAEESTMRKLTLSCIGIGAVSLVLFGAVSVLLARWATKPVAQAWAEQRQFVADASHELKTPLTVILTNAELLQQPGATPEQLERYSRGILTMSHQMRALVESLLELARVDNGAARGAFEEIDLSELVSDEVLPFEPVYFERGRTLQTQIGEGIRISGSPRHLRQVVGILLDNAVSHSPEGSLVSLRLTRQGNQAVLTVANPAAPMSREDCQNIFRRFYRLDQARTGGGYGLGLPIARAIVTDHGGRIWAESREEGIVFTAQLPIRHHTTHT